MGRYPNSGLVIDRIPRLVYGMLIAIFDILDDILRWARPFDKNPEDRVRKTNSPPDFALNP
jgi:hypothetical protein